MCTAPLPSPASIDNDEDMSASTCVIQESPLFKHLPERYDGVLVACYSSHPLTSKIKACYPDLPVTGIFEASVLASIPLLGSNGVWGIVTTGKFWEDHLSEAVKSFLGQSTEHSNLKFSGVFSTGLTAGSFHGGHVTPEVIRAKIKEATQALLRTGTVQCVAMGCAGMAGLEDIIREAIKDEYGPERAAGVYVIDGVRAGVGVLEQTVKHKRMFLSH